MEIVEDIKRYSEVVYFILCETIGNEDEINLNRVYIELSFKKLTSYMQKIVNQAPSEGLNNFKDFFKTLAEQCCDHQYMRFLFEVFQEVYQENEEMFKQNLTWECSKFTSTSGFITTIASGSIAEGFDFQSSDLDIMMCTMQVKILRNPQFHDPFEVGFSIDLHLEIETINTPPGFARLLFSPYSNIAWSFLCTAVDEKMYFSNVLFKLYHGKTADLAGLVNTVHGPCITSPGEAIDLAHVVTSDAWPNNALGCVHRMLKNNWPSEEIVQDMVKDGCLFVAIGSKLSSYDDIEWRISFSLAEKRLVHSMNHTQFLTYGLLKILLKEVIEQNTRFKGLLCSYFMKTLVFWEIMESTIPWTQANLVPHFWNSFRRLLGWIQKEHCPNFFIPENNMFFGKIHGRTAYNLNCFLSCLYREGYLVLQNIPVIRHGVDKWRFQPQQRLIRGARRSKTIKKLLKLCKDWHCVDTTTPEIYKLLKSQETDIVSEFCDFLKLSQWNLACYKELCSQNNNELNNRTKYLNEKVLLIKIKASSPDRTRSLMFLAVYFYNKKQYHKCISLIHKALQRLDHADMVHTWNFNAEKYSSLGGDILTILNGMYRYTTSYVPIDAQTCMPEILEECTAMDIALNPRILAYFILFLCHFQKRDFSMARANLEIMNNYIRDETNEKVQSYSIGLLQSSVSWEILGVCLHMMGDFKKALQSFENFKRCLGRNRFLQREKQFLEVNNRRIIGSKALLNII